MQFKIYSTEPLPIELRSKFELPAWPYYFGNTDVIPQELMDYFEVLNIVRYQDDVTKYPTGLVMPFAPEGQFYGFFSSGWLDDDNWNIIKWPMDAPPGMSVNKRLHKKIVDKTGDDYAWGEFNTIVNVVSMDTQRVKLGPISEEIKNSIRETKLGWKGGKQC